MQITEKPNLVLLINYVANNYQNCHEKKIFKKFNLNDVTIEPSTVIWQIQNSKILSLFTLNMSCLEVSIKNLTDWNLSKILSDNIYLFMSLVCVKLLQTQYCCLKIDWHFRIRFYYSRIITILKTGFEIVENLIWPKIFC